jgi:hypothetical protein
MVHHGILVLVETSQKIIPLLELLEGLLVGCALLLKKTAQLLDFCLGTGWKEITEKTFRFS